MKDVKPKILHISTSLENGGAEALLFSLVQHDTACEHVVISLFTDGFYADKIRALGYEVHALGMSRSRLSLSAIITLAKLVRKIKPDIVQTWMYHANFLGGLIARVLLGKRVYWGVHNTNMDPDKSSKSMVICNRACALLSRSGPNKIIHSSKTGKRILIEDNYYEPKVLVIPGGYDLSKFSPQPDSLPSEHFDDVKDGEFVFAMIARWNPQKDHQNLINAVKILSEQTISKQKSLPFRVLLVGPDMDASNAELTSAISEANVGHVINLLGPIENVPGFLQHVGVHILSSAYGESFPNVVNEAMACTVPCIVTDVGDSAYIVGDTGWVVPPQKPEQLAAAMSEALNVASGDDWQSIKQSCRERVVNNFGIDSTIAQYHSVWGIDSNG